jgi:SAM-dependent methyltransferase
MKDTAPAPSLFGERGGQHPFATWIDHAESYGPEVIRRFVGSLPHPERALDLGAGTGRDLKIVKSIHPGVEAIAVEAASTYARELTAIADRVLTLDIERAQLPFPDGSLDLVIANQVLEHAKEIFWIFHEISRAVRIGGHVLIGVPNVASWHNRLLLLFGVHPTQHKLCSAHVRPFSKRDTLKFLEACFPGGYQLASFAGAQFYPFPPPIARTLARAFPTAAFSIFFLLRKLRPYADEFATYPSRARFETNFWSGNVATESRYEAQHETVR